MEWGGVMPAPSFIKANHPLTGVRFTRNPGHLKDRRYEPTRG